MAANAQTKKANKAEDHSKPPALEDFMADIKARHEGQDDFQFAVEEMAQSVIPYLEDHPEYCTERILERLTEPDRIISFRVSWEDDDGQVRINRGYRVQFNNALGPYKGGLRFVPDLTLDTLKFLAFEQCFKNALTGMPMGGAKGGADFNPKGCSEREIMRFCQAFMTELHHHIGPDTDVPAGDVGVGQREIGYLFGHYLRLENRFHGVLTGKQAHFGGSLVRKEATGYGAVYFCQNMLSHQGDALKDKKCIVSGAGNVALYAAQKIIQEGGILVAMSDTGGTLYAKDGFNEEQWETIRRIKEDERGRLKEYTDHHNNAEFREGKKPWDIACDIAFPCAIQNEIQGDDARALVKNGAGYVVEGANMPCTREAIAHFQENAVLYAPGKAANAGGVAVSGLEQTQNAMRLRWSQKEVDERLHNIMQDIHDRCVDHSCQYGETQSANDVNYVCGANIAGFVKLADALRAAGIV